MRRSDCTLDVGDGMLAIEALLAAGMNERGAGLACEYKLVWEWF